jgi:hypothetical protein
MNSFIQANLRNNTRTANGMATNSSSGNPIVDLFFLCGAARNMPDNDIITVFNEAYQKDSTAALRIAFWARDIEKGLGERRFFRVVAQWLDKNILTNVLQDQNFTQNIVRVDDLVYLADNFIQNGKNAEADAIITFLFGLMKNKTLQGIVAKWMPRKNSKYGKVVRYMRSNGFINSYSEYRHQIVSLTNVVEQNMSAKEWDGINLEHVPSIAMKKYKKAFHRHNILKPFVEKVVAGEAKLHAKRLFPYEIVKEIMNSGIARSAMNDTNRQLLNEQWKGLQQLDDLPKDFRAIPIIDVSGSMTNPGNTPMSIAIGIGMFMAENNPNETFRNYFITFSDRPEFQKITGADIVEKVKDTMNAPWGMNTNIEAAFKMILRKAVEDRVPENEMPTTIIILSDMEFDQCARTPDHNAIEMIRDEYTKSGYNIPTIVFWNINGMIKNIPAQTNDKGVLLVSGASQNVINFILKQGYKDLMNLVLEVVNNPRYQHIN